MKINGVGIHLLAAVMLWIILGVHPVLASGHPTKVILYGDDSYPPYSFLAGNKPEGIYYRILKAAAERIPEYDIRLELAPYKRLLKEAERGSIFAVFPPYYRPKTRPFFFEYSVPLYTEEVVVFCGKDVLKNTRPTWPEDYFGLRIGNNDGFEIGGMAFAKAVDQGKLIMENSKGTNLNIRKLLARRIDCYINDRASILWCLKTVKANNSIPYVRKVAEGTVIRSEMAYVAYSRDFKAPYKRDFINRLNKVIEAMRKSGEIDKIVREFLH